MTRMIEQSTWECLKDGRPLGKGDDVKIWWGHGEGDAIWACKEWRSEQYNGAKMKGLRPSMATLAGCRC